MQNRDITLDIAKGLGIILVVVGHCINGKTIPGVFVYAFHMPLFFFISGVCFNAEKHRDFLPFLQKRVRQLLLPAIVFSLVLTALSSLLMPGAGYKWENLLWQGFPGAIWFLGVLFVTELLYWFIYNKVTRGNKSLLCISAALSLVLSLFTATHGLCNPYQVFATFGALFFYGVGHLLRPFVLKDFHRYSVKCLIPLTCILFAVECASTVLTGHHIGFSSNDIAATDLIASFTGLFALLSLSRCLSIVGGGKLQSLLIWQGNNTLVLMAVHIFFIQLSCYHLQPLLSTPIIYKVAEQLFVWTFCLLSVWLVNHYAKWAIGK